MTEQEAIKLARNAVLQRRSEPRIVRPDLKGHKSSAQKKYERLFPDGLKRESDMDSPAVSKQGSEWIIRFKYILPPGVLVLPSSLLVTVDDLSGEVTIPLQF